jgi:hypothetical protein
MSAISPTYGVGADQFTDEDMELARRVVLSGAQVLDRYFTRAAARVDITPRDWWTSFVDWDILFMADETRCVLGQIFGTYTQGVEALVGSHPIDTGVRVHNDSELECVPIVELNAYWATAMGYYTNEDDDEAIPYGALEIAWLEVRDNAVG